MKLRAVVYEPLVWLAAGISFSVYALKFFLAGKRRPGFLSQRLFFGSRILREEFGDAEVSWFHAASVGEASIALELARTIRHRLPERRFLFTTQTFAGYRFIRENGQFARYLPLDSAWLIRRFCRSIHLKSLVIIETELWPNLISSVSRFAPVILYNAKINFGKLKCYAFLNRFLGYFLDDVDCFFCRNRLQAGGYRRLGVPREKIEVNLSMKFKRKAPQGSPPVPPENYGKNDQEVATFVWGSVDLREFPVLLKAALRLREKYGGIRFVLAPRHLEDIEKTKDLPELKPFKTLRWKSSYRGDFEPYDLILVDEIGFFERLVPGCGRRFRGRFADRP